MRYNKPDTSELYRADPQECLDHAQHALEMAEDGLDFFAATAANQRMTEREPMFAADLLRHAQARIALGQAWTELALAKHRHLTEAQQPRPTGPMTAQLALAEMARQQRLKENQQPPERRTP